MLRTSLSVPVIAGLLCAAVGCGGSDSASSSSDSPQTAKPQHIFWIMMENHSTGEIIGNTADAPYLNQLANQGAVATNYFGVTHPSLPNYLAAISGDFQGIFDDCKAGPDVTCAPEEFVPDSGDGTAGQLLTPAEMASAPIIPHWFDSENLVDEIEGHHLTWKAYMQSMPAGFTGEYWPIDSVDGQPVPRKLYAQKHNPFMYFSDIRDDPSRMQLVVPFTQFDQDITGANVPNFVWISPDQCHDMHGLSSANATAASVNLPDCAAPASGLDHAVIALGDQFLSTLVPKIMASSAWRQGSIIVITWDEDDYAGYSGCCDSPTGANGVTLGGANAPAIIVASQGAMHSTSATAYNHYSVLATIEHLWGLGCLANTCDAEGMTLMTALFGVSS